MNVVSLSVNDLIPSKDNFYSIGNLAELKESIQMFGVKQNLTVKPHNGSKYIIISGHRRHQACLELIKEGQPEYEYIPCSIESEHDEIKEKILLITTNSTIRELSDWEKMRQAQELRKYFEILKKRDKLKGEVRDFVAESLNTSATQIGRLNAISKNLSDDFKEEFRGERIGLSAAYELSGLPPEKQEKAFNEYTEKGSISINDAKTIKVQAPPEKRDFADMTAVQKTDFVINSLHTYFPQDTDKRIVDFILTALEYYKERKSREFKSFYKTVRGNEGNTCLYNTRLDTYGCGCQHNCSYCYAKSLLSFRNLWDEKEPKVADIKEIEKVDYSKYTHKHSNYEHLPLDKKIQLLGKLELKNVSVCEDVPEHYVYWAEHFNPNKFDCCNLE